MNDHYEISPVGASTVKCDATLAFTVNRNDSEGDVEVFKISCDRHHHTDTPDHQHTLTRHGAFRDVYSTITWTDFA